ncbi:MAG: hypothetical protein ACE366_21610 [Bradymonadia bacterium]
MIWAPLAWGQTQPFAFEAWPEAPLNAAQAERHLMTAAVIGDGNGALGDPRGAANVERLRHLGEAAQSMLAKRMSTPLQRALLARAAVWMPPGPALSSLMSSVAPEDASAPWPEGYERLQPTAELVRRAIEHHGDAVLPLLAQHPQWAADRGLAGQPLVARLPERLSDVEPCLGLTVAAERHSRAQRRLAGALLLERLARECPTDAAFGVTLGAWWRASAIGALEVGDLRGAEALMRRAWWITGLEDDGDLLADVLVEQARARFAEEAYAEGQALWREVSALRPDRPSVIALKRDLPRTSGRARVGVLIMGMVVLWFAVRRLRRLWGPSRPIRFTRTRYADRARRGRARWYGRRGRSNA